MLSDKIKYLNLVFNHNGKLGIVILIKLDMSVNNYHTFIRESLNTRSRFFSSVTLQGHMVCTRAYECDLKRSHAQ